MATGTGAAVKTSVLEFHCVANGYSCYFGRDGTQLGFQDMAVFGLVGFELVRHHDEADGGTTTTGLLVNMSVPTAIQQLRDGVFDRMSGILQQTSSVLSNTVVLVEFPDGRKAAFELANDHPIGQVVDMLKNAEDPLSVVESISRPDNSSSVGRVHGWVLDASIQPGDAANGVLSTFAAACRAKFGR
jgi:hypothetical protein